MADRPSAAADFCNKICQKPTSARALAIDGRLLQSALTKNHVVEGTSTSCVVKHKVFTEKPLDARIEFAVERRPIETRGHIGANARYECRELRRAWCYEDKVSGWHDMNVRLPR
jgi:hypothetical protein